VAPQRDWELPVEVRPKAGRMTFDLDNALASIVHLRTEVPEDAFTATILGTERDGNGVVIRDDGLVLTIGYLIAEAETIWLTTSAGAAAPGHVLAYDHVTGFGLVQPLGSLGVSALQRGSVRSARVGDEVITAGHGGRRRALSSQIVAKREFAGYWEYLLDEAIFTAPAHPHWGGAALIDRNGRLLGIGSLLVQGVAESGEQVDCNMIVPIDYFEAVFDDLLRLGRVDRSPRPWLGMYTTESEEGPTVVSLARGGPAYRAELRPGDHVVAVADQQVSGLADLYRKIWALGPAGTAIPLTLSREGDTFKVQVGSADRDEFLKKPRLQ
jgi:S1-C subfamily serine protease